MLYKAVDFEISYDDCELVGAVVETALVHAFDAGVEALRADGGNGLVEMVNQSLREGDVCGKPGRIEPQDDAVALLRDEVLAVLLCNRGRCAVLLVLGLDV